MSIEYWEKDFWTRKRFFTNEQHVRIV